jgi:beta-ketoacyl-acyl-carrier-protein synthase II
MIRRVVITGIGIVAPSGVGKTAFWDGMREGASFVSPISKFDASRYASRIAGEVKELTIPDVFSKRLLKKLDRFSHMALVAADLALKDGKVELAEEDLSRVGVFIGNALGGWQYAETELRDLYVEGLEGVSPYQATAWFPAAPQGQISIYYGIKGYSKTVISDRASSLMALGYAARTIKNGSVDVVLAGGTEAPITPYALLCCNTYGSLSARNEEAVSAYRPFDGTRDGFVIGEGAGIVVLEEMEHALKRGAHIYGEVVGYATSCDGYHRVDFDPEGDQLARAIKMALHESRVSLKEVDYICADGAATESGDKSETRAVKKVFGEEAYKIPMSAPKSMIGNLLGASGAVDLISTLLSMEQGYVLPTINYREKDPECDLDYVPLRSRHQEITTTLIHSRGRGGVNTVLVVKKV